MTWALFRARARVRVRLFVRARVRARFSRRVSRARVRVRVRVWFFDRVRMSLKAGDFFTFQSSVHGERSWW